LSINKTGQNKRKIRILLVDDDKSVLLAFSKGLRNTKKFEVDIFDNAETVLERFKSKHYDLLILDVLMPKLNGFELYDQLQKRKLIYKEKVCFITGHEVYYDILKKDFPRLEIGCFIKKPIKTDELVKKIKEELKL
jgi:DNA-binding NtrC family response regulator